MRRPGRAFSSSDNPVNSQARIDELVSIDKVILDGAEWRAGPYPGGMRWVATLADLNGSVLELRLVIDAYPSSGLGRYIFQAIAYGVTGTSISRMCAGDDARHHNRSRPGIPIPPGIDVGWIYGPHIHEWGDNRHLADSRTLPEDLYFAKVLPSNIKSFPALYWHFCKALNITSTGSQVPLEPLPDRLL